LKTGGTPVRSIRVFSLATLLCISVTYALVSHAEEFSVREYEEFHRLLHPLQHEALPKKDFATIRAKAEELVKRGDAIVKLGVPRGTAPANVDEFKKELKRFENALARFSKDAKNGTEGEVEASYSAVHDSFEVLAGMLPRKQ
jgi:hypothetical protein